MADGPSPSLYFRDQLTEVGRLLDIHGALTGRGPGRRHNVEILNKSAVVFLCASFEAFVERLASDAYSSIVNSADNHSQLPLRVRQLIAKQIKESRHDLQPWLLAGDGWRAIVEEHRSATLKRHVGHFNTPKMANIVELLSDLLGIRNLSREIRWRGMGAEAASAKLTEFITLRGALAHGERPARPVTKKMVRNYLKFLALVSVRLSNLVREHCRQTTGAYPWRIISIRTVR